MSTGMRKGGLLSLPPELRYEIWRFCLKLEDEIIVTVSEQGSFFCEQTKHITPHLLQVNHQIYSEGCDMLYGQNTFTIRLHEGSCMRNISKEKLTGITCAIPSLWTDAFRPYIYKISRMQIEVMLSQEDPKLGLSQEEEESRLRRNKNQFNIIKTAIEELSEYLDLSRCLKDLTIKLCGCARRSGKDSGQHLILLPLLILKGLTRVEAIGVPENFAMTLKTTMERRGINSRNNGPNRDLGISCLALRN